MAHAQLDIEPLIHCRWCACDGGEESPMGIYTVGMEKMVLTVWRPFVDSRISVSCCTWVEAFQQLCTLSNPYIKSNDFEVQ